MRRGLLVLAVLVSGYLGASTIQCSGLPDVYVDGQPLEITGTLPDVIVIPVDSHHHHHDHDD